MIEPKFYEDKGTLLLSLSRDEFEIPKELHTQAKENGFNIKEEFHITIIGFKFGQKILEKISNPSLKEILFSLIRETDWSFQEEPIFFHVQKDYVFRAGSEHRESIVRMIHMPAAEEFYAKLHDILGVHIEEPPLHISLFTKGNPIGIGINSFEELEKLKPEPLSF